LRRKSNTLAVILEDLFQSRAGFLPCRDLLEREIHVQAVRRFQSRAGFLPRRDAPRDVVRRDVVLFQSRTGFLLCRDTWGRGKRSASALFQSRAGFLPCRDTPPLYLLRRFQLVSIPYWVSTVSRPTVKRSRWPRSTTFQSRTGFLPCRDRHARSAPRGWRRFNPVLGFYRVATWLQRG